MTGAGLKNKNDYSVVAFSGSRRVHFMKYVHDVRRYASWLERQNITWSILNVYNRRTGDFITRFYNGHPTIGKPK